MITCREFVEFLMDYLDGELPAGQRGVFDRHLELCAPCVAYLQSYLETVHLESRALDADRDPLPEDVPEQLVRAILEARKQAG